MYLNVIGSISDLSCPSSRDKKCVLTRLAIIIDLYCRKRKIVCSNAKGCNLESWRSASSHLYKIWS